MVVSKFTEHFDDAELLVLSERNVSLDDILKETYKRTSTANSSFSGSSASSGSTVDSFNGFSGANSSTATLEHGKVSSDIFAENAAAAFSNAMENSSSTNSSSSKNNKNHNESSNKKKPFRRLTIFSKSRR